MVTNVTILGVLPQAGIQKYFNFFYSIMLMVVRMKRKISGNITVAKMMNALSVTNVTWNMPTEVYATLKFYIDRVVAKTFYNLKSTS